MKYFITMLFMVQLIVLSSCNKDFLDKSPEEDITIEEAFLQRRYAEAFLTDVYASLPLENWFTDMLDPNPFVIASDEMNVPWPEKFAKLMNKGSWNAYNVASQQYRNMYEGIRKANIFIKYIDTTPLSKDFTQQDKDRWIGEATYLRAFYHFWLMRIYGPVPIMDYAAGVADDFTKIRRQPLDKCITFVANECDKAINLMPMRVSSDRNLGRVTAAAAYALKARLLLYAASPLWNGNSDYASFTDNEGLKLFPAQNQPEKWADAAKAAKECITECEAAGYELFRKYPDPVKNYQQIFLENNNVEVILARNCNVPDIPGYYPGMTEKCAYPGSLGGWNGYNPTQQQVDAYEMDNGQAPVTGYNTDGSAVINSASGYTESGFAPTAKEGRWLAGVSNMYVNRDPRFYASINFNGAFFIDRQLQFWETGADGRGNAGRDYNTTGYLLKKSIDPTANIAQGRFSPKTWIFFRLGEFYLDYAEALNEAEGPVSDVYKYVNLIRERAGMPALPAGLDKDKMRERIRNERRVELSYETHRYFDCHRWKIAAQTDNGPIYGMNIAAGNSLQDNAYYQRTVVEQRVFQPAKHYLFPIPQSEIDKTPNVIQNPGW
ncbi:MAG: RagB/SusD family nutrient uptake outer membrane protein [Sphingobacteriaceae bacterium]|nr:MAG: RagB/SusD family nutrient uptake outer membrane protein [Sphingobacteriaceae bacterium]